MPPIDAPTRCTAIQAERIEQRAQVVGERRHRAVAALGLDPVRPLPRLSGRMTR
jgi:hypothetical protein